MKKLAISLFFLFATNPSIFSLSTAQPIQSHQKNNVTKKSIKLYTYKHCPYCHDVINFLKKKGWANLVVVVNADDEKNYQDLKNLRPDGLDYCPFLVDEIHEKKVTDSKKIMNYLQDIFSKPNEL